MSRRHKKKKKGCPHGNGDFCPVCLASTYIYAKLDKTVKSGDLVMFEGRRLSEDQVDAVAAILGPERLFFMTGQAGSGKSFVVQWLKQNVHDCYTTAMTGVAAQLIDDTTKTAHSFLGIHPEDEGMRRYRAERGEYNPYFKLTTEGVNEKTGKYQPDYASMAVQKAALIIIDEISMANSEFMSRIAERFRVAGAKPKLVLVGDPLQLPPTEGQKFFLYPHFHRFRRLQLRHQHRQTDTADTSFLKALNEIRVGQMSDETRQLLSTRIMDELPTDCTHLHAKNINVEQTNLERLHELEGEPVVIPWNVNIEDPEEDENKVEIALRYARKESRFMEELTLKEGARVILLTNDKAGRWVNGSSGTILDINQDMDELTIRLDRNSVDVIVPPAEQDLYYGKNKIGSLSQFPVKLAWAMTIHKAQGSTMDRVGVNLNDHFENGMTYVALSRCRTLAGLHLCGSLPDSVRVDQEAIDFLTSS